MRHEKLMAQQLFFKALLKFCTTNEIFDFAIVALVAGVQKVVTLYLHLRRNRHYVISFCFSPSSFRNWVIV